jgi:hypothetical protein
MNCFKASLLFLLACIPVRLLIAYAVQRTPEKYRLLVALALLVPAIGFLTIYFKGLRQNPGETFGCNNGQVWWNDLRPIHGLLYATAAVLVLKESPFAHYPLYLDVLIGITAFVLKK